MDKRYPMPESASQYIRENKEELLTLIKTLTLIPSPSNHEEKRAEFCKQWLEKQGCKGVYIDEACNVVYPYKCEKPKKVIAFLAHIDTVFPDQVIEWKQEGNIVNAMGVGDDTTSVAVLMMIARYVTKCDYDTPYGIVFVGNAGEEGLGNLKGSRQIVKEYGDRMYNFIAFDGSMTHCTVNSVGSQRYKITVRTEGGHSYGDYGNRNAIQYAASIIQTLYAMKVPQEAKTTYNVGMISGGRSVNTIPPECSFLYEFRSAEAKCLKAMENMFCSVIKAYQTMGIEVETEVLSVRPCKGKVDEDKQQELWDRCMEIIKYYHEADDIILDVNSTDANIPWSEGIPSTTIGTVLCGAAHTKEEWIDISTIEEGFHIAMNIVLSYLNLR